MKIHVMVACHNRQALTLAAVENIQRCAAAAGVEQQVVVYDAGSIDGTAEALANTFPEITVLHGHSAAFWAQSMAQAETEILSGEVAADDYFLWLNDDVTLDRDALVRILPTARKHADAIVVGAMRDPDTGAITYSGLNRNGLHPLRISLAQPRHHEIPVDTFNGNFILVPVGTVAAIGGIDGGFAHALADVDYGFRARKMGVPVLLAPGTYGLCSRNPPAPSLPIRADWLRFTAAKGAGHPGSMYRILHRLRPRTWPLFMASTYSLWWVRRLWRITSS